MTMGYAPPVVLKGGGTMTGELAVPDLKVSGIGTATQGGRFVGVTTSGAPSTGTWVAGDFCFDLAGSRYFCIASGTPGTWRADVAERGYSEWPGAAQVVTAAAGATDIAGLAAITFTVLAGEIVTVEGFIPKLSSAAAATGNAYLTDNANAITGIGYPTTAAAASAQMGLSIVRERIVVAGTYTRKLRVQSFANTVTWGSGSPFAPTTLRAFKV